MQRPQKLENCQWSCVLFTHESGFSTKSDSQRFLICREIGTRFYTNNIKERHHYGGPGVLVCGGIKLNGRTELHIFDRWSVTGDRYCEELLLLHVHLLRGAIGPDFIFMDDNTRSHRTLAVEELLEREDITRIDWPAYIPDFNPIKHVWDALKRRIASGLHHPENIQQLKQMLIEEWALLPQEILHQLVLSMRRRIKGKALPWISNFLNHRSFCVNFHATFSDSCKTYQGIPEGCVLSPTLFSLFISGVVKYVNPSQIGLFADDVVLWCSDANISKIESQLYRSLVNIQELADNHKITFNASKSTFSLFTTYRNLYNYSPEFFLMSERLNYSKYPTYLGFSLDSEVNCGKHIEKIADKARKRLKILKYLSGRDWGSDASTLRITYTALVPQSLNMDTKSFN
ncbi:transposable element Tcb2 transposase [Trichonephila clavipes]|nr:transposable element Tcb2 transposase [Trichonephila clavipes]